MNKKEAPQEIAMLQFFLMCGVVPLYAPLPNKYILLHTMPCAIMARATFMKPAMLAPFT